MLSESLSEVVLWEIRKAPPMILCCSYEMDEPLTIEPLAYLKC